MAEALVSRATRAIRESRAPYLCSLVIAVVVPALLQYLWQYVAPGIPIVKGQPPGVWSAFLLVGVALVFWLLAPARRATEPWLVTFFALLAALWAIEVVLSRVHGDAVTYGVLLYPVVLVMLVTKMPTVDEGITGIAFAAWFFAAVLVTTRFLELVGVIPMATVSPGLVAYEKAHYWLPLSGWLGPEGRWPGPFFHNAQTGNVGAFLLVAGVALRRRWSWVLVVVGVVTLLLTNSRGSIVAAAFGLAIALFLGDYRWNRRIGLRTRMAATLGVGAVAVLAAVAASPNLTGRDVYWKQFLDLWRSSPWIGVGVTGRVEFGAANIAHTTGHNLVIDALAHYGVFTALGVVALLVVALVIGIRSTLRGLVLALALIVTYVVIGIAESDYSWMTGSNPWLMLLLAVIVGGNVPRPSPAVPLDRHGT